MSQNTIVVLGSNFQNWVVRNMNILKARIHQLQESVDSILLNVGEKISQNIADQIVHSIPLNTPQDVEVANKFYENDDNRKSLVSTISSLLYTFYLITKLCVYLCFLL